jgi:hypothetical protein
MDVTCSRRDSIFIVKKYLGNSSIGKPMDSSYVKSRRVYGLYLFPFRGAYAL